MSQPSKKLGRPPTGKRKRQVFVFLPNDYADWFMAIPPKERTAWIIEMIENERKSTPKSAELRTSDAHPDD